jgi:hypothetical protein
VDSPFDRRIGFGDPGGVGGDLANCLHSSLGILQHILHGVHALENTMTILRWLRDRWLWLKWFLHQ